MFRHLLINTVASATAFTAISIVGFILIPVLVGSYGLKEFGLIVLARLFLPSGLFFLFDFGFSEIASQSVARARETKAWGDAAADIWTLLLLALGVGVVLGSVLFVAAEDLGRLFGAGDTGGFGAILRATGLALPLLFPATTLEGVVKGYGAFRSLRLIEVSCTLLYAGAALLLAKGNFPFTAIAYAFLAATLLKGGLIAANAARAGFAYLWSPRSTARGAPARLLPQCLRMAQNRVLGVLLGPAQQPLIGLLVGPAGVSMFEVLTKLPRFCKAAIGLLGSALIPVAARLDAKGDAARVEELASWGMLLSSVCALPPLAGAALFSEPVLRLWTGPQIAAYWPWQALMFVWPMAVAVTGFGSTALIVRSRAFAALNRIVAVQIGAQLVLAVLLLPDLHERSFLLAQALGVVGGLAFVLRVLVREHRLQAALLWRLVAILAVGAVLAAVWCRVSDPGAIEGWESLGLAFALWCLAYWSIIWLSILQPLERQRIGQLLGSLMELARPGGAASSR
jgi:O-antigen/teichoic acid export membrane protein